MPNRAGLCPAMRIHSGPTLNRLLFAAPTKAFRSGARAVRMLLSVIDTGIYSTWLRQRPGT
jgi:hypothetical protein